MSNAGVISAKSSAKSAQKPRVSRLRRNDLRARGTGAAMPHRSCVHGPREAGASADTGRGPALHQLDLADGLDRFLAAAEDRSTLAALLSSAHPTGRIGMTPMLFQPVQRVLHLALIEATCARFASQSDALSGSASSGPLLPLDRRKVRSAGLVVRRLVNGVEQRWVRRAGAVVGWVPHPLADQDDERAYEPVLARRRQAAQQAAATDPTTRVLVAAGLLPVSGADDADEAVSPAFAVPPTACAALESCLIYGVIPTASTEASAPETTPPFDTEFLAAAIPGFLRRLPKTPASWRGLRIPSASEIDSDDPAVGTHLSAAQRVQAADFRRDLLWLMQGAGYAPAPAGSAAPTGTPTAALTTALALLRVGYDDDGDGVIDRRELLSDFLIRAQAVLLDRSASGALQLPHELPALTSSDDTAIVSGVVAAFTARWNSMSPAIPRFAAREDRYVVRAFVRIAGDCGCDERIRWSAPSAPFAIAPWFASAGKPPLPIALPDLGDLAGLAPNVAFALPPALRSALDGVDMKGLLDGKKGGGLEFGMICSFSIPIITLCAFIILSIFLSLLHIVFQWLLWVKICIPFPKKP